MDCRCVIAYSLVFLRFLAWSLLKSWNRALVIFVLVPVHFCRCFASCSLVRGFQTFAICKKCTAGMAVHRMGVGCILSALRPHCMCLSVCLFLSQLVQVWDFLHMIKVSSEHWFLLQEYLEGFLYSVHRPLESRARVYFSCVSPCVCCDSLIKYFGYYPKQGLRLHRWPLPRERSSLQSGRHLWCTWHPHLPGSSLFFRRLNLPWLKPLTISETLLPL